MTLNYDPTPTSETETLDDIVSKIEEWIDELNAKWNGEELDLYDIIEKDAYRNVLLLIRTKKSGLVKRLRMQKLYNKRWQPFF